MSYDISTGEIRVRTEFNPSKTENVDLIKQKTAELINLVESLDENRGGSILCFVTEKSKIGHTSIEYTVRVYKKSIESGERVMAFSTNITFVCLDDKGAKKELCCGYKEKAESKNCI